MQELSYDGSVVPAAFRTLRPFTDGCLSSSRQCRETLRNDPWLDEKACLLIRDTIVYSQLHEKEMKLNIFPTTVRLEMICCCY